VAVAGVGDALPASRVAETPVGDADIARLTGLSLRADIGACMPRGVTAGTGGRPPIRARALCGASPGELLPAAVRRRALSVDLVGSLGVMGPLLADAAAPTAVARALSDPPEPAVVAADACVRLAPVGGDASLAKTRCTSEPDVLVEDPGRHCPGATATALFVAASPPATARAEPDNSRSGAMEAAVAARLAALAAAAHEPDDEPPAEGDGRRRGVDSTLVEGGVCARCEFIGGGELEGGCRGWDGEEVLRPLPYLDGWAAAKAAGAMEVPLPGRGDVELPTGTAALPP